MLVARPVAHRCADGRLGGVTLLLRLLAHLRALHGGRPAAGTLPVGHLPAAARRARCDAPLHPEAVRPARAGAGARLTRQPRAAA